LVSRLSLAHLLEKLVFVAFFFGLFAVHVPAEFFVSGTAPKKKKRNKTALCVSSSRAVLLLYRSVSRSLSTLAHTCASALRPFDS
jgi:hypothetical protein